MISVVVIDDERRAANMLHRLLEEIGGVRVDGVFTNPLEALERLESGQFRPDAVFLDIDMPGMRGTEAAQRIQNVDETIHILFVTAYRDYAIEAFDLHSLDYVLKPVSKERLEKSVARIDANLRRRATRPRAVPAPLAVRCFGKFQLIGPDGEPLKWRTARTKELCAFLAHYAGQAVERDVILETIWPDTPLEKALAQLYTIVSYLRKMFADEGARQVITKGDSGYKMDLSGLGSDVREFEALISAGGEENQRKAAALYEDHYMQEEQYPWAVGRQEQLKREAMAVFGRLSAGCRARGERKEAAVHAERMLQLAPYSDEACRRLMELYAEAGRRSDALIVFRRFEAALRGELRVEPEDATLQLSRAISGAAAP
ncbi:response regulator [Paenibacillus cymbidii]|uniref:response regulator n=1 Tax=Paenibacillus cymbidii TaxID=1639034 RepID=UPI001081FC91|nr:response regulator [Paenibacillus cymbidii]